MPVSQRQDNRRLLDVPQTPPTATPRKVLLTGSAGALGRCIAPALVERGHDVRGFDVAPDPYLADHITADLTDAAALDRAMAGRDTLIHLAAYPNPAPFVETLLGPNVVGLYQTVDAAKRHGLSRLILASSIQVISGLHRRRRAAGPEQTGQERLPRPDHAESDNPAPADTASGGRIHTRDAAHSPAPSHCGDAGGSGDAGHSADAGYFGGDAAPMNDYALTKLWAEQLGAMTARTTGIDVLAVRLGWFVRDAAEAQRLAAHPGAQGIYLSPRDARDFFVRAVEADLTARPGTPGLPDHFAVLYAVGPQPAAAARGKRRLVDLAAARRWLAYDPRDRYPEGMNGLNPNHRATP